MNDKCPFYYLLDEVVPSCSSDMTCEYLQSVLQINIIEGGKTPILSPVELGEIGYSLIVYSVSLLGVSMRAMEVCTYTIHMKHVTLFFYLSLLYIKDESCKFFFCLNTRHVVFVGFSLGSNKRRKREKYNNIKISEAATA